MYIIAILSGPLMVIGTLPFYGWSMTGGLCTMCIISFVATKGVWQGGDEK